MHPVVPALLTFALLGTTGGCGGDGDAGGGGGGDGGGGADGGAEPGADAAGGTAACSIDECGGDPVGTWSIEDTCSSTPVSQPIVEQIVRARCPEATAAIDFSGEATIEFGADHSYSDSGTYTTTYTYGFPASCFAPGGAQEGVATCADLAWEGATCTGEVSSSGCNCEQKDGMEHMLTGTWTVSGAVLSVDLDDSPFPTELTFCRHGEVLETREGILQSEDGTMLDEVFLRLSSS